MATFASQPAQFAPYVPQVDTSLSERLGQQELQAQVQVGMHKQEQYNINAQKIQGMIDSIAGLQVSRDVDKQYMNQAMSSFKNDMQKLVKGDFSQMQKYNQAGSLASTVANDPRIQTAVISTRNEQDALAQMQDAHKNGKASPTNDNFLLRNIQQWRNDPTAGASLGKQAYTPFFDYQKGFQDFMKDKHGNVIVKQDPFSNNEDGSPNWRAYALVEGKEVELSPIAVMQDAQTYFASNAQAKSQLDIDSVYFSDKTDTKAAFQRYQQTNRQHVSMMENEIKRLQSDSALNPVNGRRNQDTIEQYRNAITKSEALNAKNEQSFINNPESAKMSLYQDEILKGFGQRFAYKDIENKIIKNPIFDADMDVQKLDLQKQKFGWEKETWTMDYDQRERKMSADEKNAKIAAGILVGGDYNAAAAEAITPEQYTRDLKTAWQEIGQEQLKTMYGSGAYPDLVELAGADSNGNPLYKTKTGVTQEQRDAAWNNLAASYEANPAGANRWVKSYFDSPAGSNSGIGRERVISARLGQAQDIENRLNEQMKKDPALQAVQAKLDKLGPREEILGTQDGISVTRGDLIQFSRAKNSAIWNPEDVSKQTGLPLEKVKVLGTLVRGESGSFTGDLLNLGKTIISAGAVTPATLKKEYARVVSAGVLDSEVKAYDAARKKAFQDVALNSSQFSVGEDITKSGKLPALQATLISDQDATDRLNKVTGEKNAGKITLITRKDPVSGEYTAFVRNEKGTQEYFEINRTFASTLAPQLTKEDPHSAWLDLLEANRRGKGTPSSTGKNGPGSFVPKTTLLKKYDVRYQVSDDGGNRYSPDIQYREKGSNTWYNYPFSEWFNDPTQVDAFMNKMVTNGGANADQFFEETLR